MITETPLLRTAVFFALLSLFAILEAIYPRRDRKYGRQGRWLANLGVLAISTILARVILPIAPVGAALWAQDQGIGLFNSNYLPLVAAGILTFVSLDLLIYYQHRLFHSVPVLWRLHRMHHTDMDLDVTSGLRFHPIEILLSLAIKIVAVCALGAPPVAVLIFELTLNGTSMFNHSNLALPSKLDRVLRFFIVTPDMHRVHHSARPEETNSNFGFNIPIWDHLFRTYRANSVDGQKGMTIGLTEFRDERAIKLNLLLLQPFMTDSESVDKKGDENSSPP